MNRKMIKGIAVTLLAGTCWGFSGTCGQFLFQSKNIPTDFITCVRMLTAGLILTMLLVIKEGRAGFSIVKNRRDMLFCALFAVAGVLCSQYTYLQAIAYSNAGTGTILQYVGPVLIMLAACLLERRRPSGKEVTALLLAVLGVWISATHGDFSSMAISGKALAWGLASAVALVFYTMAPEKIIHRYGSLSVTAFAMLIGGAVMLCFSRPWRYQIAWDAGTVLAMLFMIVFGTAVAYTMYLQGVKLLGSVKGSLCSCIEPVSATLFAALWLDTKFGAAEIIGFVCILSTVVLLALDKEK